jgi:MFS family permease
MGVAVAATSARFAEIKGHAHTSDAIFGYCIMVGNLGSIFGNFFGSKLSRRIGTRRTAQLIMIGVAGSQIAYGFVNQAWEIPFVAFAAGASYSLMNIACNSQGSMIQESVGRSLMPSFHGSWSIGACTASFGAGALAKYVPVEWHLLGNSLIALFGCYFVSRALLPFSADQHDATKNSEVPHNVAIPMEIKNFIWMVAIGSFLATIAETSVGDWSSIYLKEDLHMPIGVNTVGYTCFVLAQIVGRFSAGSLIDRFGIPRVIRVGGLLGGFGYLLGLIVANIERTNHQYTALAVMCIAYAILGLGVAPMPPSYVSVAGSIPGVPTARALTRLAVIASTGFFIGRFIISSLAGLFGLPIALLFPATALIGSGVLAHHLDVKRIKTYV